jgi:hypothetical protein
MPNLRDATRQVCCRSNQLALLAITRRDPAQGTIEISCGRLVSETKRQGHLLGEGWDRTHDPNYRGIHGCSSKETLDRGPWSQSLYSLELCMEGVHYWTSLKTSSSPAEVLKVCPHESSNIQQGWGLYEPKLSGPGIGLLDKRSEADITRPTGISFFSYPLRQNIPLHSSYSPSISHLEHIESGIILRPSWWA